MNRNQRKNRPKKKEKSEPQWDREFNDLKRMYERGGDKKDNSEES